MYDCDPLSGGFLPVFALLLHCARLFGKSVLLSQCPSIHLGAQRYRALTFFINHPLEYNLAVITSASVCVRLGLCSNTCVGWYTCTMSIHFRVRRHSHLNLCSCARARACVRVCVCVCDERDQPHRRHINHPVSLFFPPSPSASCSVS